MGIITVILAGIAGTIISGIVAFNWLEPQSFIEALVFILVWGLLDYIITMCIAVVTALIFKL
tara:strand:+ start:396 stop:581 length:186 start_codon:yes stop_codon:yes gene_type:complete